MYAKISVKILVYTTHAFHIKGPEYLGNEYLRLMPGDLAARTHPRSYAKRIEASQLVVGIPRIVLRVVGRQPALRAELEWIPEVRGIAGGGEAAYLTHNLKPANR